MCVPPILACGHDVMEGILQSEDTSQICAVWAHNDDMALGAIQAIEEYGLKPGEDIKIVSVDAARGAFVDAAARAVRAGVTALRAI